MDLYRNFKPTQYDGHIALPGREDWLVLPCARNRDSSLLEESNFACALQRLGGESDNVEVHRFGHWGNGWFEIILVAPNSGNFSNMAYAIEGQLSNYPILDRDDYQERQQTEANRIWEQCYTPAQRIRYIHRHRSQFEFQSFADMLACVRGKFFAGSVSWIS